MRERESAYFSNATHEFGEAEKVGLVLSAQNALSARGLPLQDLMEVGIRFVVSWDSRVLEGRSQHFEFQEGDGRKPKHVADKIGPSLHFM